MRGSRSGGNGEDEGRDLLRGEGEVVRKEVISRF